MTLSAFHGRAEVRQQLVQNLRRHVGAGPLAWNDQAGSVAGCLIESEVPQAWTDQTGLPQWMAYALDVIAEGLLPADAFNQAEALLHAVPLGTDAGPSGSQLVVRLLDSAWSSLPKDAQASALQQAMAVVQSLHRQVAAGALVDAGQWRRARQQAMAVTNVLVDPREKAIAACIESAGWDPQKSPTLVAAVLRQWMDVESLKADSEFGWTEADHAHIQQRLDEMHQQHLVGKPEEKRDVFLLLEAHHPDEALRLREYINFGREHQAACAMRAGTLMTQWLRSTS